MFGGSSNNGSDASMAAVKMVLHPSTLSLWAPVEARVYFHITPHYTNIKFFVINSERYIYFVTPAQDDDEVRIKSF